jgi:serine/threonine protein kinase/tetratricopeptide (TPR) repeat protein
MSTPSRTFPNDDELDYGATLRGLRAGLKVFGRYTLTRQLGRGGMGVVWLARDGKLDLDVALKFLPETLRDDKVAVDELRRETKRCLHLTHDLIVRTFDLAEDGDMVAIAMEFVDGSTLAELRLNKPSRCFEAAEVEPWLRQICDALAYAHDEARMVHRDLKPSNIMLNATTGRVKLADFGIASSLSDTMSRLTRAGANPGAGTLVYMSPQQLMGFPPAVTDDVYSLGATLYELFTCKPPFFRGSIERQIESMTPPSMTERRAELNVEGVAAIPEMWEKIVAACLDKDAAKRPQSVAEVWRGVSAAMQAPVAVAPPPVKKAEAKPVAPAPVKNTVPLPKPTAKLQTPPPPAAKPPQRRQLVAALAMVTLIVVVSGWWLGYEGPRREQERAAEQARMAQEQAEAEQTRLAQAQAEAEKQAAQKRAAEVATLVNAGRTAYDSSDYATARTKLEGALALEPGNSEATRLLDQVKTTEIKRQQEQQMAAQLEKKKSDAASLVAEARSLYNSSDYDGAKQKIGAALYLVPGDSAALTLQSTVDDAIKTERERAARAAAMAATPPPVEPSLPPRGYFDMTEVFDGTSYDGYNAYSRGQILAKAQQKLKAEGFYHSAADGDMGPGTQHAIIAYQRQHSLSLSGKLDYGTQNILGLSGIRESSPPVASKPKQVPASRPQAMPPPSPSNSGDLRDRIRGLEKARDELKRQQEQLNSAAGRLE